MEDTSSTGDSTGSDSEQRLDEVRRDPAPDAPVSNAVTEAVAAVTGTEPKDLRPLYDVVDPDALDGLFEPTGSADAESARNVTVAFSYEGCSVRISSDGRVVVASSEDS